MLAHKNGYWVDWSKVSREELYKASDASFMRGAVRNCHQRVQIQAKGGKRIQHAIKRMLLIYLVLVTCGRVWLFRNVIKALTLLVQVIQNDIAPKDTAI